MTYRALYENRDLTPHPPADDPPAEPVLHNARWRGAYPPPEARPYTPAQEDRLLRFVLMSDAEWRVERKRLFGEDAAPLWPSLLVMAGAAGVVAGYVWWAK